MKLFIKAIRKTPIIVWFSKSWWRYLLEKGNVRYCSNWRRFWCRAAGHPDGVWWYNMSGTEPDMTCKCCGDDLG